MGLLDKLFRKKEDKIKSHEDFWNWFLENEQAFYKAVKTCRNIETDFFNKLSPKLDELKDGYFYLTGMFDENLAELIFTADGNIKNIIWLYMICSG
ncbi:hypothetical protein SAMN06295967_1161 [Belliella buryatensis]|uniref:DUF695 domain-containing protein n=1 Tax=Belliella buryatensis TaxID=1500549 RepID=A0A239GEU5_9BACT|nr:hypothetical protein [Belliella buryatensis]SNS67670.1 hypothetical protein SAMN06295967_1161 [Belliella buryatensis]